MELITATIVVHTIIVTWVFLALHLEDVDCPVVIPDGLKMSRHILFQGARQRRFCDLIYDPLEGLIRRPSQHLFLVMTADYEEIEIAMSVYLEKISNSICSLYSFRQYPQVRSPCSLFYC